MRQDQVALQGRHIRRVNPDRGEFAKASVDPVNRRIARSDFGDALGRPLDAGIGTAVQYNRRARPVDFRECLQRNCARCQSDG